MYLIFSGLECIIAICNVQCGLWNQRLNNNFLQFFFYHEILTWWTENHTRPYNTN